MILTLTMMAVALQGPTIKIDNGNTVQLCGSCPGRRVRMTVSTAHFTLVKGERPTIVEVSSANQRVDVWSRWITPTWDTIKAAPVALILEVSDSLTRAGVYDVILLPRPGMEKLKVSLVVPAGQLEVPDKLLITRTVWWLGASDQLPQLEVRETTGASAVSQIGFANKQAMQDAEGVTGELVPVKETRVPGNSGSVPVAESLVVGAGQPGTIPYRLRGEFPRGKVIGVIRLVAPQLTQPVTLNYEVQTRIHSAWILIVIIAGLCLGYQVRNRLQARIVWRQAQVRALEVLSSIATQLARYDSKVLKDIMSSRGALRTTAGQQDPAGIDAAIIALKEAWAKATKEFEERLATATSDLQGFQALLDLGWALPQSLRAVLERGREVSTRVAAQIENREADVAGVTLTRDLHAFGHVIRQNALDWQLKATSIVNQLRAAQEGLPEVVRIGFEQATPSGQPPLSGIGEATALRTVGEMEAALDIVSQELGELTEVLARVRQRGEKEWQLFQKTWPAELPRPDQAAHDTLTLRYAKFLTELDDAAAAPEPLAPKLDGLLKELQESWKEGILAQASKANVEDRAKIEEAITNRRFVEAGRLSLATSGKVEKTWGELAVESAMEPYPEKGPRSAQGHHTAPLQQVTPAGGSELDIGAIRNDLSRSKWMQSLVVGTLMVLWAYTTYDKGFDGTLRGLLTPFFATFLLDISVDGLKQKLGG